MLIPSDAFRSAGSNGEPAGPANGRALAFLAHQLIVSTVAQGMHPHV
jgi:hypothetical protein